MLNLRHLCDGMGFVPRVVCEVGVNEPDKCSVADFLRLGAKGILVEPLPWCAENLRKAFPAAAVHEAACGPEDGIVRLYDRGEGSWIEHVPIGTAPDEHIGHSNIKRQHFDPRYVREVPVVRFSTIDPGNIDILCVDVEGAEYFVISQMISRPRIVRVETHFSHSGWENPNRSLICRTLELMGYRELCQDVSDTYWVLPSRKFRAGDQVLHFPSGEEWTLGVDEERGAVMPLGWPESLAQAKDCSLIKAASEEKRLWILAQVGGADDNYLRTLRARQQLAKEVEGRSQ